VLEKVTVPASPEVSASDPPADEPPPQVAAEPPPATSPEPTAPGAPDTPSVSLDTVLRTANESSSLDAWTQLFALWSVDLPAAVAPEYCVFASYLGLSWLAEKGSWGLLRQYDRPAIMQLVASDGQSVPVFLRHLGDRAVDLVVGTESMRVAIDEVDRYWFGEFTLLLRLPPNGHWLLMVGDRNPDVAWLRQVLEVAQQVKLPAADPQYFDARLQEQVTEFQRRHGLRPDGVVGRQTLIRLDAYSDGTVPALSAESS